MAGKTLYDKVWDAHVVHQQEDGTVLLYIDRHLVHEVTSPQAFEGLQLAGRKPWRTSSMLAVADHNVPTTDRAGGIKDPVSRLQIETLDANCKVFGVTEFKMNDMLVSVDGQVGPGVTAKDIVLAIIGKIGTAGGTGCTIEFAGQAIRDLSMEGRMSVCNMSIEAGARAGMIAVDDTTIEYLKGRPYSPKGEVWDQAEAAWRSLNSDDDAHFDEVVHLDASTIEPQVSWGTSPEMVTSVNGQVPDPGSDDLAAKREGYTRALEYMDLHPSTPIQDIHLDRVFIGSCTNSRIEDLRAAAAVIKNRKVSTTIKQAMVVPGSGLVKRQAEQEGLDKVFTEAGFEWREPGCSMCLAMNADRLEPGERCASTSNRNFEGRQGQGGRTHLVSPAMAAAAAIAGHFVDVRSF